MNPPLNHEIKGWCPSAQKPMASGDGLLMRVNPPLGRLTAEQFLGLANLADKYGNGTIDLTRRAALQIRGIREDRYSSLLTGLQNLKLVEKSESPEIFSSIVLTPFRQEGDIEETLWHEISKSLSQLSGLPSKFGVIIDTGKTPCLDNISGDIRIERSSDNDFIVRLDGCEKGIRKEIDEIPGFVHEIASWFSQSSGVVNGRGRIAGYLDKGGNIPSRLLPDTPRQTNPVSIKPGLVKQGYLIAFPFGQATLSQIRKISDLDCPLIMTPWRMLLLEGLSKAPDIEGILIKDCSLLAIDACTGAPLCTQAKQKTRKIAMQLAEKLLPDQTLHISGCTKGCARSKPADYTFIGTEDGFDLVRNGRADEQPIKKSIAIDRILQEFEACNDL